MTGHKIIALSLALVYLSGVDSGIVSRCKSDDSNCALKSAEAFISQFATGLPEYNVKTLDPISFKRIDSSSKDLKLILTDVTVTGLKNCNVKKVQRDKPKNKLFLKLICSCQLEGQYEMDGQLLILPIKGKGPIHVTMSEYYSRADKGANGPIDGKAEFSLDIDMGEKEKSDVKFWDIKGWKYTYTLKDKSDVVFENLFNGNEVLAQAARSVISENGNEIILEVGPPVLKTVIQAAITQINSFFHKIPAQELSLD